MRPMEPMEPMQADGQADGPGAPQWKAPML